MTTLYCAVCGHRFEPDDEHIWIQAERKPRDGRPEGDEYALHVDCWDRISGGWMDPA